MPACLIILCMVLLLMSGFICAASAQDTVTPGNPDTDWFHEAGWGVFLHYLNGLQNSANSINSLGKETSWDECVNEFDTELFAEQVEESGAGYVIFTVMQCTKHLIAPNETYNELTGYKTGEACSTRDLIEDLYQSLHKRGIPLMLYWTGDGPRLDPQANAAIGFEGQVTKEFVKKWTDVVREYSLRYRDKIAGWWVDGSYPFIGYTDETLVMVRDALKAGNPKAIVAFNNGVLPVVTSYTRLEDYTTGEENDFFDRPVSRWLDGEQWHIASFLGSSWGQPGVRYSKTELAEYIAEVTTAGGVVSIDVMLYRDGGLDRSQFEVLKSLRQGIAKARSATPIPPGNLAFRKPARLLSLDGSHELVVNGGTHFPRNGVDGKLETIALAGGEWAWSYQVDLLQPIEINKIKVTFGSGYPTHYQVLVSQDLQNWQCLDENENGDSQPIDITFEPTLARYIRIASIKPDGPDQPGSQMSVRELEVY